LLCRQLGRRVGDASDVPARTVNAGYQAGADRVSAKGEHNRNLRGPHLPNQCVADNEAGEGDDAYLPTGDIRQQCRQAIVLTICEAIFDRQVLALDIRGFIETPAKRDQHRSLGIGGLAAAADIADHWRRRLLRLRNRRPRGRPADLVAWISMSGATCPLGAPARRPG